MFYNKCDAQKVDAFKTLIEKSPEGRSKFKVNYAGNDYTLHQVYNSDSASHCYVFKRTDGHGYMHVCAADTRSITVCEYNTKNFTRRVQSNVGIGVLTDDPAFSLTRRGIVYRTTEGIKIREGAEPYKTGDFLHKDNALYGVVIIANHDALVIEDKHGKTAIIYSANTCLLDALDIAFVRP